MCSCCCCCWLLTKERILPLSKRLKNNSLELSFFCAEKLELFKLLLLFLFSPNGFFFFVLCQRSQKTTQWRDDQTPTSEKCGQILSLFCRHKILKYNNNNKKETLWRGMKVFSVFLVVVLFFFFYWSCPSDKTNKKKNLLPFIVGRRMEI